MGDTQLVEKQIEQILNNSFLRPYLEDIDITDISFDGVNLRLQNNITGPEIVEIDFNLDDVGTLTKQIADLKNKPFGEMDVILDTDFGHFRVNSVHEESATYGRTFSLRVARPTLVERNLAELADEKVSNLLEVLILANESIILCGATGTGKTELQKSLVSFIKDKEIIVVIEDTRDSHIKKTYPNKHIFSWLTLTEESRKKKVTFKELVKAGLRNNPDWLIISEIRGDEAADVLDVVKSNHSLITTVHAKRAKYIPTRLLPMIQQSPAYSRTSEKLIGKDIIELLRFGVHLEKVEEEDGRILRRIKEIVEFTDFNEEGAVSSTIYQVRDVWDKESNSYKTVKYYGAVSDTTREILEDKHLVQKLPSEFKNEK